MSYPGKGRADYLALGDWNVVCYECGFKRKASMMKRHWQGYYVCPEHWEPRQTQDFVRAIPDTQTPPWTQPPSVVFRYTCDIPGQSATCDYATATCSVCDTTYSE